MMVHFITPLFCLRWGIVGGYLIFGPGHILVESWGARNSGGYPIFEPKYILLQNQVASLFLGQNASCSKFSGYLIFRPGHILVESWDAQNLGGYPIFEPKYIL